MFADSGRGNKGNAERRQNGGEIAACCTARLSAGCLGWDRIDQRMRTREQ